MNALLPVFNSSKVPANINFGRNFIYRSIYSQNKCMYFQSRCYNIDKNREGFGSFHSQDVEVLIRQSNEAYSQPSLMKSMGDHTISLLRQNNLNFELGVDIKERLFAIDSDWVFINHGAFGGALEPLLREANTWRYVCESQPLKFYDRELLPCIVDSIRVMARFLNCPCEELLPLPNVTSGLNSIINSIPLNPGDEVLCLSLTYGSTKKVLKDAALRTGAKFVMVDIKLPIASPSEIVEKVSLHLTGSVKLAIFDQVTSNTAMTLPIDELGQLVRLQGGIVVIDAAHSLYAQDVSIDPSYTNPESSTYSEIREFAHVWLTNGHKWLSAPKGCAFMWVNPSIKYSLRPPIISHGFEPQLGGGRGFQYQNGEKLLSGFAWDGCRDYSAMLSIPSALRIWTSEFNDKGLTLERCRTYMKRLLSDATALIAEEWKISEDDFAAPLSMREKSPMSLIPLPAIIAGRSSRNNVSDKDAFALQEELHHKYAIEVPIKCLDGRLYARISAHVYNHLDDYKSFATAMKLIANNRD